MAVLEGMHFGDVAKGGGVNRERKGSKNITLGDSCGVRLVGDTKAMLK